ncbi:MAG: glycoside hydrolase family 3 C-terminal domain-containing protein, partial [Micrococcales bacterium]|nr:glycoside hydrolase family 3 C-terminal domain-containing protein [Micrococcales bacterium]
MARAEFVNSPTTDYYNTTAGRALRDEFGEPFAPLSDKYTPANGGFATSFTYGLGQASSWNRDLVRAATSITSDEARAYNNFRNKGLVYWSPTMNLARDPRWGRSEEAFGEDAYLAGEIAGAFVQGMQGDDPKYLKAVATPKHFYAQNSEDDRHVGEGANITEREQREYYTYHYAKAMGEYGSGSGMTGYNSINGIPASADKDTLLTMARRTWGFTGYFSSDCSAIGDMNFGHWWAQGFGIHNGESDEAKAVAAALKGGTDLDCTSNGEVGSRSAPYQRWMSSQGLEAKTRGTTAGAYERGYVTEADIDIALQRAFTIRFRLGEFDAPEKNPWPADQYNIINPDSRTTPSALAVAQQTSDEAVVMLENRPVAGQNVLPLQAPEKIAVIGSYAQLPVNGRKYDPRSRPAAVSPLAAITARANAARAAQGLSAPDVRHFAGRVNTAPSGNLTTDKPALGASAMAYPANPTAPYPYPASYADGGGNYGTIAQFKDASNTILSNMPTRAIRNLQGWTFPASYGRTAWVLPSGSTWLGQFELVWDVPAGVTSMDLRFTGAGDRAGRWDVYLGRDKTGTLLVSSTAYNMLTLNVPLPPTVAGTRATFFVDYHTTNPGTNENYYQASFSPAEELFIQDADVVIVYAGQGQSEQTGHTNPAGSDNPREGNDRGTIQLPKGQDEMIARAAELNPKTIAYIQGNDLVDVSKFKTKVAGLFWTTFNGQFQSDACARLLWGDANPSGKTPTTWYANNDDIGWITDYQMTPDATHNGRTYMYFNGGKSGIAYPFGYGLSYSKFSYSNLQLSKSTAKPGDVIDVSIDVTNTSSVSGKEVVELYVTSPFADGVNRPRSQLKGFDKVSIGPGQTRTVTIPLDTGDMWFWDDVNHRETFDQGQWKIWVGGQSVDGLSPAPTVPGMSTSLLLNGKLAPAIKLVVAIPDGIVLNTSTPDSVIHANLSASRTDQGFYDLTDPAVKVKYTSSDTSIAQVDSLGTVKAVGPGAAVITATVTADGSTESTTFPVIVQEGGVDNPVPDGHRQTPVNFASHVVTLADAMAGVPFAADVVPDVAGTTYDYTLSYYTDNTAGASVAPDGTVTATSLGTATVNVLATIPGTPVLKVSKDAVLTVVDTLPQAYTGDLEDLLDQIDAEGLDPSLYTASSWADLEDAIQAANDLIDSGTATDPQVADAIAAVQDAYDDLVLRGDPTALQAVVTTAKALAANSDLYTATSWAALEAAIAAGEALLADLPELTQTDADAAAAAIRAAIVGLDPEPGVPDDVIQAISAARVLTLLLADVATLQAGNFTPSSWTALQAAVDAATALLANPAATATQLEQATHAVTSALMNLEPKPGLSDDEIQAISAARVLTLLLADINGLQAGDFTADSWADLQTAVAAAALVLANPIATATQLEQATHSVTGALIGLKPKPGVPDDVIQAVSAARVLTLLLSDVAGLQAGDYTTDSWSALQSAIFAAALVLANPSATAAQLEQATHAVTGAILGLKPKPGLSDDVIQAESAARVLSLLLADAAGLQAGDYTADSWAAMQSAVNAAGAVLANPAATVTQLEQAIHAVTGAMFGLKPKPGLSDDAIQAESA